MTKKQWSDKFEKDNGRKPNERELKVAKQSDYKIKTDIKLIKETKLVRAASSVKKTTAATKTTAKETAPKKTASKSTSSKKVTTKKAAPKKTAKKDSDKTITLEDLGGTSTKTSSNKGLKIAIPVIGGVLILLFVALLVFTGVSGNDKSRFYQTAPEVKQAIKQSLETGLDDVYSIKVSDVKVEQDKSTKDDKEPQYNGTANVGFISYDENWEFDGQTKAKVSFVLEDVEDNKSDKDSFYLTITNLMER